MAVDRNLGADASEFLASLERETLGETSPLPRDKIRWMQTALARVGGARLAIDGIWGPRTAAALRAFQAQRGLPADGVFSPTTEAALRAAFAASGAAAAVSGLVRFNALAGVPTHYARKPVAPYGTRGKPRYLRCQPGFRQTLDAAFADLLAHLPAGQGRHDRHGGGLCRQARAGRAQQGQGVRPRCAVLAVLQLRHQRIRPRSCLLSRCRGRSAPPFRRGPGLLLQQGASGPLPSRRQHADGILPQPADHDPVRAALRSASARPREPRHRQMEPERRRSDVGRSAAPGGPCRRADPARELAGFPGAHRRTGVCGICRQGPARCAAGGIRAAQRAELRRDPAGGGAVGRGHERRGAVSRSAPGTAVAAGCRRHPGPARPTAPGRQPGTRRPGPAGPLDSGPPAIRAISSLPRRRLRRAATTRSTCTTEASCPGASCNGPCTWAACKGRWPSSWPGCASAARRLSGGSSFRASTSPAAAIGRFWSIAACRCAIRPPCAGRCAAPPSVAATMRGRSPGRGSSPTPAATP